MTSTSATASASSTSWEESNGLLAPLIPQVAEATLVTDPRAFNAARGELKLGPLPISDDLAAETEKALRDTAMHDRDPGAQHDPLNVRQISAPGLIPPDISDLPPHPPTFKTSDIAKHVARVRDQRLQIRLDPSALQYVDPSSPQGMAARHRALPSICAYTLHDVPEGYVASHSIIQASSCSLCHSSPCCTFSQDTSLMAAGFEESYIRLWSLKGEALNGMRSNFEVKRECMLYPNFPFVNADIGVQQSRAAS